MNSPRLHPTSSQCLEVKVVLNNASGTPLEEQTRDRSASEATDPGHNVIATIATEMGAPANEAATEEKRRQRCQLYQSRHIMKKRKRLSDLEDGIENEVESLKVQ